MKELLEKLINLFKWLFRWLKYIIVIIIGFIYSLFKKEETLLIKKEIEKRKPVKEENKSHVTELPHKNPNGLIKNSLFSPTKEMLKEELLKFYLKEKNIKKYQLEKADEEIIKYLEEKLIPILEEEILKKHIKTAEKLEEEIKKLGTEELLILEDAKNISPKTFESLKSTPKIATTPSIPPLNFQVQENNNQIMSTLKKEETLSKEKKTIPNQEDIQVLNPKVFLNEKQDEKIPIIPHIIIKEEETLKNKKDNILSPSKEELVKDTEFIETLKEEIKSNNPKEEEKKLQGKEVELVEENTEEEKKEEQPLEQEKEKEEKKEKEEIKFIDINLYPVTSEVKLLELENKKLAEIPEFEDKNYDELLLKLDGMLKEIAKIKGLNLKPEDKKQVLATELKLKNLQMDIENKKEVDLENEKALLEENITEEEITKLLESLKALHLEHQIDLNEHLLTKAQDLEYLSKEKASIIEKELIKTRLKKASHSLELPSFMLIPFIRNRYFLMFTMSVFINNHLNILGNIIKHKDTIYTKDQLEHIKKGSDSLEEALNLTITNIAYLNHLEQNILTKYPELSLDEEYLLYINRLRYSLLKNEEKLLKKKQTIQKYNLKYQIKIRKLKKKKKVA